MSESHPRAADIAAAASHGVLVWPRVAAVMATLACAGCLALALAFVVEFKDSLVSSGRWLPARIALHVHWPFVPLTAASLAVTTLLVRNPAHPAARGYGNLALGLMLVAVATGFILPLLIVLAIFVPVV